MMSIRWETNKRCQDQSTNLETVMEIAHNHKNVKVCLPVKGT
jgi:hypothetical protein